MNTQELRTLSTRAALLRLLLLLVPGIILFGPVLWRLFDFSQNAGSSHYSHFVLIPFLSGYLLFVGRRQISFQPSEGQRMGLALLLSGIVLYLVSWRFGAGLVLNDQLALLTMSMLLYLVGCLGLAFGVGLLKQARFPLLFLLFMVPVPAFLLESIVISLQVASAAVVDVLFDVTGTPHFRDGFVFSLPTLEIEVAKQCSGIRSSLSLFIVSILAGHLSLKTTWGKTALAIAVFPITVFKNGVRIVLLSIIAIHWDRAVLHGNLHTSGGIPFFVVAMTLLGIALFGIRWLERRRAPRPAPIEPEAEREPAEVR